MPSSNTTKRASNGNAGLFLRRFISQPAMVASVIPSSKVLIRKVVGKMELSKPRIIAEFGPGEGCHTREILRRAHKDSKILLFELDPALCKDLAKQFAHDPRVHVLNANCCDLAKQAAKLGIDKFDYIFSGIPFSFMDREPKQALMHTIYDSLQPGGSFIIYQVTNELKRFGQHFDRIDSEWCPINIPPMFVTVYYKNGVALSATA